MAPKSQAARDDFAAFYNHATTMINALSDIELKIALREAICNHGPTQAAVQNTYDNHVRAEQQKREAEKARVIDFSDRSRSAWHVLNYKYTGTGSEEYEHSRDATCDGMQIVGTILNGAQLDASFGTRKSALETLRKIGKSLMMAPSTLGSEVKKQLAYDPTLPDAMERILLEITVKQEQRLEVARSTDEKGSFIDKFVELQNEAYGYVI